MFSPFSGFLQFAVSFPEDHFVVSFEFIFRGDIADGAVKADSVIILDELADKTSGILKRERDFGSQALAFDGTMPTFQLAVALGINWACKVV